MNFNFLSTRVQFTTVGSTKEQIKSDQCDCCGSIVVSGDKKTIRTNKGKIYCDKYCYSESEL